MPKYQKKHIVNQLKTEFSAVSVNESLSRSMICAMIAQMDVSVSALADVRCAISEAVTNAIIHGYAGESHPERRTVYILATLYDDRSVKIIIRDRGCGISDVTQAMEPLYTTDTTGERSGMGFAIMQSFMDSVKVKSQEGRGTTVELRKQFPLPAADTGETAGQQEPSGKTGETAEETSA